MLFYARTDTQQNSCDRLSVEAKVPVTGPNCAVQMLNMGVPSIRLLSYISLCNDNNHSNNKRRENSDAYYVLIYHTHDAILVSSTYS